VAKNSAKSGGEGKKKEIQEGGQSFRWEKRVFLRGSGDGAVEREGLFSIENRSRELPKDGQQRSPFRPVNDEQESSPKKKPPRQKKSLFKGGHTKSPKHQRATVKDHEGEAS